MPAGIITITTMTTTITTTDGLLRLLAWLSPAFPTGGFAWSHGVEWAVESGDVTDAGSLTAWVGTVLRHGSGRSDAILLRLAHRAAPDPAALCEVATLGLAVQAGRERLAETVGQGNAFRLAAASWGAAALAAVPGDLPYPVAVGALAAAHAIAEDAVCAAYLQAFASNLISAAVRLVPMGQSAGLAVLASLGPVILAVAAETRGAAEDDLGGCAFRSDLAAMKHETQYTRLFRS
jgi:urease accessory protein